MAEEATATMAEEIPEIVEAAGSSSVPMLAALGVGIAVIAVILKFVSSSGKVSKVTETKSASGGAAAAKGGSGEAKKVNNKVVLNPQADAAYLVNCLRPSSTPLEILYAIATTPDTIAVTSKQLEMAADLRAKKAAHLEKEAKAESHKSMDDLFDDDGWAEDDDDDPAAAAAKKAKEEKEKEAKRLAKATGKDMTDFNKVKLEGVDDGVLGQEWVTKNLTDMGAWPPPSIEDTIVANKKFSVDGKIVGATDHPAVRRNLIMTMGRLNAKQLNTHPDLVAAGPKGNIDPTYFQSTMEYRQRVGPMLEATLRMACTLRSFRLACSVLDAIVMFKIGLKSVDDEETLAWFADMMKRQYGPSGTPKLVVADKYLGVPTPEPSKEALEGKSDEEKKKEIEKMEIARKIMQTKQVTTADEKMALEMQITRQHAESFLKEKLAMCQKQGIPPQMALATYRESWFILVRARRLNDDGSTDESWDGALGDPKNGRNHMHVLAEKGDQLYGMLEPSTVKYFEEEFADDAKNVDNKIVIGWPFVIANVAQKTGRVKVHLPPPAEPGRYEFTTTMKSQDFLGVAEEFVMGVEVAKGVKKEKVEEAEAVDDEPKKEK